MIRKLMLSLSSRQKSILFLCIGILASTTYCYAYANASSSTPITNDSFDHNTHHHTNTDDYEDDDDDDDITLFNKYTGLNTSLVASIIISKDEMLESWSNSHYVYIAVTKINQLLTYYGVPSKSLLTTDEFVLASLTIVITLVMYYLLMGKGHVKKRKRLAADLKIAQEKVNFIEIHSFIRSFVKCDGM